MYTHCDQLSSVEINMDINVVTCMPGSCLLLNNYWMRLKLSDNTNRSLDNFAIVRKPEFNYVRIYYTIINVEAIREFTK